MEPCRLSTGDWAKALRASAYRLETLRHQSRNNSPPPSACNETNDKDITVEQLQEVILENKIPSEFKKTHAEAISRVRFSSPEFPESVLADHGITFVEGASPLELAQKGFQDFPFLLFAKEWPLDDSLSEWQLDQLEKELIEPHEHKVARLAKDDQHLSSADGAAWELDDEMTTDRKEFFKSYMRTVDYKNGRSVWDDLDIWVQRLLEEVFFFCTRADAMQNNLYQGPLICEQLKPDIAAGPLMNDGDKVVSLLDIPALVEAAELLSSFEAVPGTAGHPLPFIVGEIKKDYTPYCAEDKNKVLIEMLMVRLILEALFENPPQYTFGILQCHREWRIYAMTKDSEGYIAAEVFCANDTKMLDRVYIGTVLLRLATYFLWQLQGLRLVSKEKQLALRDLFQKPKEQVQEEAEGNNVAEYIRLSDICQLKDNIFSAKYRGEECIVKVGKMKRIVREYQRYEELKDSPYVAEVLNCAVLNDTRALLVLKQYKPLPIAKTAAELLRITKQLLTVLTDLHERRGFVHCDIKNGNIVWDETNDCLKLIDFETCLRLPKGAFFKTHFGTELFKAPEQLFKRWRNAKVDVFSAGLVCAAMAYGGQVHCEEARETVLELVYASRAKPEFAAFLPLFNRMLEERFERRIPASKALVMLKKLEKKLLETGDSKQTKQRSPLKNITNSSSVHLAE